MKIDNQGSLDRFAMLAFALLLAVCWVALVGFIVFVQVSTAAAVIASAATVLVVGAVLFALNRAAGF